MEKIISLLCALPNDIVCTSLLSFMDVLDLVRLCGACAEHNGTRNRIREFIRSAPPQNLQNVRCDNQKLLNWVINGATPLAQVLIPRDHALVLNRLAQTSSVSSSLSISLNFSAMDSICSIQACPQSVLNCICSVSFHDFSASIAQGHNPLYLPNVRQLRFNNNFRARIDVGAAFASCPNVQALKITGYDINFVVDLLPQLRNVGSKLQIVDLTTSTLPQSLVDVIGQCCSNLQQLSLVDPNKPRRPAFVELRHPTVVDLRPIAEGCALLQKLEVRRIDLPRGCLASLLSSCSQLEEVDIQTIPVDADALGILASNCSAVHTLKLTWACTSSETVTAAAPLWATLRVFHANFSLSGSNDSLALCLSMLRNLEALTLDHVSWFADDDVLNRCLQAVALSCKQLTFLTIASPLPSKCLTQLSAVIESSLHLKHCSFTCVKGNFDPVLIALGRSCPRLESLAYYGEGVTDVGVSALARGCYWLQDLVLQDCTKLTDAAMSALQAHCPHLHTLSIACCQLLTETAVVLFARGVRKLRALRVHHRVLSNAAAQKVRAGKGPTFSLVVHI